MATTDSCPAAIWKTGKPCGRTPAPGSPYCPTHRFVLEPDAPSPLIETNPSHPTSVNQELALTRLHILHLLQADAPHKDLLDTLHTLVLMASLQHRVERFLSGKR